MTTLKDYVKDKEFGAQFEKFPEGDTYFDLNKTEIEEIESPFLAKDGSPKVQYLLKADGKELVAGTQIMQRIKEISAKGFSKVRVTRTGTTKDNTKYTVVGVNL